MTLHVIELFAGIGAQRTALERLGIEHEVVAISEIDKYAIATYTALHGETPNLGDITKVEHLPDCDLLTYSFPCLRGDMDVTTIMGNKQIKDIVEGDLVMTRSGRYEVVTGARCTGRREVVNVRTVEGNVICTPEHMILTRLLIPGEEPTLTAPYWCPAGVLTEKNYVCMPINTREHIPTLKDMYGVGDTVSDSSFVKKWVEQFDNPKFWKCYGGLVRDNRLLHVSNSLIPQYIQDLPKEHLRAFLEGYLGEECVKGKYETWLSAGRAVRGLAQAIAKAYNVPVSVKSSDRLSCSGYKIKWNMSMTRDKVFIEDGMVWKAVKEVVHADTALTYDISVENDPTFVANNILVHNCTDLSMAGNRKGMARGSGTRSGLLWEVERLLHGMQAENRLPDVLLMENVDAILFKANKPAFDDWVRNLSEMGYTSSYKVLNSTEFDVPQNRKRCFMVSMLNGRRIEFPEPIPQTRRLIDLLEENVDEKYFISEETVQTLVAHRKRHEAKGNGFGFKVTDPQGNASSLTAKKGHGNETYVPIELKVIGSTGESFESKARVYDPDGLAPAITCRGDASQCTKVAVYPCLTPDRLKKSQNGRRFKEDGEPSFTLTAMDKHGILLDEPLRIRRLTPKECWRLQDFTDAQYDKASEVVSEAQLYRQAGNSITVRILMEIFRKVYTEGGVRTPTLGSFSP